MQHLRSMETGGKGGDSRIFNVGNIHSMFRSGGGLFGSGFFAEYNNAQPVFSQNTNVHPAFGVQPKIERNRRLVQSVYHQTQGYMLIGDRSNEAMSDPLHRTYRLIHQRGREEASIAGRSRAMMRPAAPQLVTWKNQYWRAQRPPHMPVIGPFTQGSLEQQSILYRINSFLRGS